MMKERPLRKGISLYPGLGRSRSEMSCRLRQAADLGYTDLFLSFHIPETDETAFADQVETLLQQAAALGFRTIGDLVPGKPVPELLTHLRLDDGFTPEDMACLQKKYPAKTLVLNASAVREGQLQAMEDAGVVLSRVEALHNFYPHPHTGLAEAWFKRQNDLLHRYGIPAGVFIASHAGRRGPLFAGLPTLEKDRYRPAALSAWHARLLGADALFFGDDGPTEEELGALARVEPDIVTLDLVTEQRTPLHAILETHIYETRPDEAEEVIRTTNSRKLWHDIPLPADRTIKKTSAGSWQPAANTSCSACPTTVASATVPLPYGEDNRVAPVGGEGRMFQHPARGQAAQSPSSLLSAGTVTLDTDDYGRYKGELEITLTELPPDSRTLVLGRIPAEELFLLPYLRGGRKFRFCLN